MKKIKRNNLIALMQSKNINAVELAERIGVSPKTIYNIIKKKNTPSFTLAKSIAEELDSSLDQVFELVEE